MIANAMLTTCLAAGTLGWIVQVCTWLAHPGPEDKARAECRMAVIFGISAAAGLAWAVLIRDDTMVIWMAVGLACSAWWWFRNNGKRPKRAPRMYGYKARAALAALARKAREAAQPRPVLRPLPGGAS